MSQAKAEAAYFKAIDSIKQVYTEVPSHDMVVTNLLKYGFEDLAKHCFLTPGVPVKAMLGRPTKGIAEV